MVLTTGEDDSAHPVKLTTSGQPEHVPVDGKFYAPTSARTVCGKLSNRF
jgi:hypothetical protein